VNYELLQEIFDRSGYTSTELAELVGISRNTVHNIMYGLTSPSYYAMAGLAEVLKLSIEEIMAIFFPKMKF